MTGEAITHGAHSVVLGPGEGRQIPNPTGGTVTFKATGGETGGSLMAFESVIAPGQGPPLHVHATMDEIIYVLEGELRVRLGPDLHPAVAGGFVFIPRGTVHTWQNVGAEAARFLGILTPAGFERFFERMAAEGAQASDQATFTAFGREVGMEVVGPPLPREEAPQRGM